MWERRECRYDAFCGRVQIGRKVGQDILRQDAMARRVEELPAVGIDPVPRAFEFALRLQDASEMLGINWNHQPRTGETGGEPGTQAPRDRVRGDTGERNGAEMAKGLRILAQGEQRDGAAIAWGTCDAGAGDHSSH